MTAVTQETTTPRAGLLAGLRALVRGRAGEPAWVRPAFLGVTALAAVLYAWNLTVSGYANAYYSAAALAASKSWSAFFFGSFDAAGFITIDKPPLALWPMGLSVRLFGLSSLSILLPEALAGVLTVGLLFGVVRRSFGPVAAVIAGVVMALTPAAVLIFRFNNPDALLTLLLVAAAWALLRALDNGSLRWTALAATFVGLAFLTKYLQAYLVLPGFALVYGLSANTTLRRRVVGLFLAAVTVLLTSGWWVAIVELIPLGSRPIAWFIPLAVASLLGGLWLRRRGPRTDRRLAGYLLWGTWFATHVLVFSYMSGIVHSYYAVALAPAVAALVGAGIVDLWALRARVRLGGLALGVAFAGTAWWGWQLLGRTPEFAPGLGPVAVGLAVVAAAVLVLSSAPRLHGVLGRVPAAATALGLSAALLAPAAYAASTMGTAYSGGDPHPGPATAGGQFDGTDGARGPGPGGYRPDEGQPPGALPGLPDAASGRPGGGAPGGSASVDSALVGYLVANQGGATWIVAANSAQEAGSIQLATGLPVMAMGGFTGSDPAPTLDQLKGYVASGQLRFVLVGGGGGGFGGPGGSGETTSERTSWVTSACSAVDYGGSGSSALYDCAGAAS